MSSTQRNALTVRYQIAIANKVQQRTLPWGMALAISLGNETTPNYSYRHITFLKKAIGSFSMTAANSLFINIFPGTVASLILISHK